VRRTWLLATVLGFATAALRLPRALADSFWQDEVASARIIREPTFGGMLHHVALTESTPPLWYALAWMAHRAGLSVHDVRLLSVVAGAALVMAAVRIAAEIAPIPFAAATGVLLAVGAQFTSHGRELRAYELFALLTVVFAVALLRAARSPSRGRLLVVGVSTAAGARTHYFFGFSIAAVLVWLWLEPEARASRRRITAAIGLALAACLPWLPLFLAQYRHDRYSWIGPFDARETIETPLRIFSPLVATPLSGVAFLSWLLVAGWVAARRGPTERLMTMLALGPLVLAGATWAAGIDVYAIRNLIGIGPFVAVLALLPLTALPAARGLQVAAAVMVAAVALFVVGQKPTPPFNRIAGALVREGWRPPDPVVVQGGFYDYRSPLEWYLPHLPRLVRGRLAGLQNRAAFAVLARSSLPPRMIMKAVRVDDYLVVRMRPRAKRIRLRGAVVITAAKKAAA